MNLKMPEFLTLFFALAIYGDTYAQLMKPPEIGSDNRVTFHVKAPGAHDVRVVNLSDTLAMGAKEYPMKNNGDGLWSVTTKPCRAGFHYYELSIDGFRCADPSSPSYFGWGKWTSGLEILDKNLDFYQPKDVLRGEVRNHWYASKITGTLRKCIIYTPPGYDQNNSIKYPVLFLQHGAGESELGWTMQGKLNIIMDNLIAAGKAKPMIVVMDNGYAARAGSENPERPAGKDNLFEDLVVNELVPMIDKDYRTVNDRNSRAIAGLSMGAGQALNTGLDHLDKFGSIGAFSGGAWDFDINTSFHGIFRDPAKLNGSLRLLWIGCGTMDDGYRQLKNFHEILDTKGINNVWFEGPGSHEWQVWRKHIYEFAQLLFK